MENKTLPLLVAKVVSMKCGLRMRAKCKDLSIRHKTQENILWHKSYQCFLWSGFQGSRNKTKNKQMGPNQTYKLLHSKRNHKQNKKVTYGLGENICK